MRCEERLDAEMRVWGGSQAVQGGERSNEENFGARRVPDLERPFD